MSKGTAYHIQTPRVDRLAEYWGDRLERLDCSDKLSLIMVLAYWIKTDGISLKTAYTRLDHNGNTLTGMGEFERGRKPPSSDVGSRFPSHACGSRQS